MQSKVSVARLTNFFQQWATPMALERFGSDQELFLRDLRNLANTPSEAYQLFGHVKGVSATLMKAFGAMDHSGTTCHAYMELLKAGHEFINNMPGGAPSSRNHLTLGLLNCVLHPPSALQSESKATEHKPRPVKRKTFSDVPEVVTFNTEPMPTAVPQIVAPTIVVTAPVLDAGQVVIQGHTFRKTTNKLCPGQFLDLAKQLASKGVKPVALHLVSLGYSYHTASKFVSELRDNKQWQALAKIAKDVRSRSE